MIAALLFACVPAAPVPEPPPVPDPALVPQPPPAEPIEEPAPALGNEVPFGFVDLSTLPHITVEPRYHSADNFTGAPLPGYGSPLIWLDTKAAAALGGVAEQLAHEGYGLLVYDGYRPVRATKAMVAWTERTQRTDLLRDGTIASRSSHNTGHTVDLTLTKDGEPVDMGTAWDAFSTDSHTSNATGEALANRQLLGRAMRSASFRPYSKEWWHFSFGMGGEARDIPYGCFEPAEGEWIAPDDWTRTTYQAPSEWTATSCSP